MNYVTFVIVNAKMTKILENLRKYRIAKHDASVASFVFDRKV